MYPNRISGGDLAVRRPPAAVPRLTGGGSGRRFRPSRRIGLAAGRRDGV